MDAAGFDPAGWTDRLIGASTTTEALTSAIESRRLDWTHLDTLSVTTERREVAEELRHQVLHDGADLRDAARRAGTSAQESADVLGSIGAPNLRAALAGARTGELVGPVQADPGWALVTVVARTEPTLADPATRGRAEAVVRADALSRAVARHIGT
ncbi:peptidylprolyl isomerase [Nocardioides marmoriginsengisoli]|nr:peptidyl-prolyl cis-trans isomerase [Nocardioides marmoriginsengisoli]